jgi:lipopolysaccharide/colanic/teichoic acid biosynthesis glycosyltransferase
MDHDFDDRAKLDLDYIDRWSFWLDLRIVAKTFPAVLHLEGR